MSKKIISQLEEILKQLEAELAASSDNGKVESSDSTPTIPTPSLGWDWVEA